MGSLKKREKKMSLYTHPVFVQGEVVITPRTFWVLGVIKVHPASFFEVLGVIKVKSAKMTFCGIRKILKNDLLQYSKI